NPAQVLPEDAPLLTNLVAPAVSGTAAVGSTLTAGNGTWSPATTRFSYEWLRDGQPLPGAGAASYRLTGADAGLDAAVRVAAHLSGYQDGAATSAALAIPTQALEATTPVVQGQARVGKQLVAVGTHSPANATVTRQWLRNGVPVAG